MSNQISQLPVEILILSDVPVSARVSQLPIEVLINTSIPEPPLATEKVQVFVWSFKMATLLTIGPVHTMIQNTIYSMPAEAVHVTVNGTLYGSMDGIAWSAIVLTNWGAFLSAPFVKAPDGNILIVLKNFAMEVIQGSGQVPQALEVATVQASDHIEIGTNPALTGAIRLPNDQAIMMRDGANTKDLRFGTSFSDAIYIGGGGESAIIIVSPSIQIQGNQTVVTGAGGLSVGISGNGKLLTLYEMTSPSLAPADGAYLFLKDNGAGKTQLMIQFATGAAIQLAIQV